MSLTIETKAQLFDELCAWHRLQELRKRWRQGQGLTRDQHSEMRTLEYRESSLIMADWTFGRIATEGL